MDLKPHSGTIPTIQTVQPDPTDSDPDNTDHWVDWGLRSMAVCFTLDSIPYSLGGSVHLAHPHFYLGVHVEQDQECSVCSYLSKRSDELDRRWISTAIGIGKSSRRCHL